MKKIMPLASTLTVMIIFLCISHSCKKSSNNGNTNNGLATQATAQASFDNQSGGAYKGDLTGSSGYFEVTVQASSAFVRFGRCKAADNVDFSFNRSVVN